LIILCEYWRTVLVLADPNEEQRPFRRKGRWFRRGLLTKYDRQYSQNYRQIIE